MEALLYPQTYLRRDLAERALQVVERLVLLRPAEYPPEGIAADLSREGRVRFLYPPPLGERLQAFVDLVSGYEEWGQWMRDPENLSLLKGLPEFAEESVLEIKRALVGEEGGRQEDPVLKARVLLALAERLDARLEALDEESSRLEARSRELSFHILGDAIGVRFPRWVAEIREVSPELPGLKVRLLAWARLAPLLSEIPEIFLTDQAPLFEEWRDVPSEELSERSFSGFRVQEVLYRTGPRSLLSLGEDPRAPLLPGSTRVVFLLPGK
ncbi:hypothetical protein FVE67_07160 [Thermosulfurimonas marina]|uniref:Uncharacterized protein n=1 Tax=Thermosulfurimonas marina TaxID=2047767 RepID=A0A6H1WU03_9BACT|nr:hypothetical protein [Thermosulfurimonas marina]QJA06586.1 hypothetical protein FVE67_07160 [Thermosulfurimonas marina]